MLFALLLNQLGRRVPKTTGNGVLMEGSGLRTLPRVQLFHDHHRHGGRAELACGFYIFGRIANILLPSIHAYAFTIAFVAFCKIAGIIPERLEFGAVKWYRFMMDHFTIVIMGGVGLTMMDLGGFWPYSRPSMCSWCLSWCWELHWEPALWAFW